MEEEGEGAAEPTRSTLFQARYGGRLGICFWIGLNKKRNTNSERLKKGTTARVVNQQAIAHSDERDTSFEDSATDCPYLSDEMSLKSRKEKREGNHRLRQLID